MMVVSKTYVFTKCFVTEMPLLSKMVTKYIPCGKRAVLI